MVLGARLLQYESLIRVLYIVPHFNILVVSFRKSAKLTTEYKWLFTQEKNVCALFRGFCIVLN